MACVLLFPLTLWASVSPSAVAAGDVRWVSPTGTGDEDNCFEADPCNLDDAIFFAMAGDTIQLLPGTYELDSELNVESLTFLGSGVDTTVITPAPAAPTMANLVTLHEGAHLADVSIVSEQVGTRALWVIGAFSSASRALVRGTSQACGVSGNEVLLTDSVCHATAGVGVSVGGTASINVGLRNTTAIGFSAGIDVFQSAAGKSTWMSGTNVIALATDTSGHDVSARTSGSADATSSVTVDAGASAYESTHAEGPGTEVIVSPATNGNTTADPIFVDLAAGDFRQHSSSPTVDAGDNGAWGMGDFDVYGNARIQGESVDIGAHELTPPPPAPTATCAGLAATIVGTSGDDVLVGTAGDDVIAGLAGDDTIDGMGGNDVICADGGNDTVRGGGGNDLILGKSGNDLLKGGRGSDTIKGQGGKDTLVGGGGDDVLKGGSKVDVLKGGGGKDKLRGQGGNDTLKGGGAADNLKGGAGKDKFKGQGGSPDKCIGGAGKDKLLRNHGCERVRSI